MFKTLKRADALALALLSAPLFSLGSATAADAQDAFNSGGWSNDFRDISNANPYGTNDYGYGDSFSTVPNAPQLMGATNGTIAPMDEDEYLKQSKVPDGRIMLGESLCDLTTREIAADDEAPPPDFPPMPKRISVPKEVTELKLKEKKLRDSYDNDRPINGPDHANDKSSESENGASYTVPSIVDNNQASYALPSNRTKYISRETLNEQAKVNSDAGNNPDFTARLAAESLKLQNQSRPKNFFEQTAEFVGKAAKIEPDDYTKMQNFKKSLAKVKPNNASAQERAKLAENLERCGKYYDALVERLRCVDMQDDGPSRFYLARLYGYMGEKKLSFETLKDAVGSTWPSADRDLLIECHIMLGDSLFQSAKAALRGGDSEVNILRLRNASVSYRRAATMDRTNTRATSGLIKVAREAVSIDPSFDNYLLLGGAYLIANDLDKAQVAYDQCAEISPDNGQLKQARMIYQLACRRRDQNTRVEGVVTARRRLPNNDSESETLVSDRRHK